MELTVNNEVVKAYQGQLCIEKRISKSNREYNCVVFYDENGNEVVLGYYEIACKVAITLL